MSELARLQASMKAAMVSGAEPEAHLVASVLPSGLAPAQRIQVHQNNYRQTLTAALLALFPVAQVFVGEQFMKGVLARYVADDPPSEAVLAHYGAGAADFLQAFPPVAQVPYLPDIVRLEWYVHELQVAVEVDTGDAAPHQRRKLSPNVRLVDSDFPVLNLWMAGTGQIAPEAVNVKSGGQCAAVLLSGGEVRLLALDAAEREFVRSLTSENSAHEPVAARLIEMGVLCRGA
jgi:hypothetical protein